MRLRCLLLHQVIFSLTLEFTFAIPFPITPFALIPFSVPLAFPFPIPLSTISQSLMHSHPAIFWTLLSTRMVVPRYSPISHPSTLLSSRACRPRTTASNMHRRNRSTYTQRRTRRRAIKILMSMSWANSNKCHLRFDRELTLSVIMQRGSGWCLRVRRVELRASWSRWEWL